jgi:hypothetical protein
MSHPIHLSGRWSGARARVPDGHFRAVGSLSVTTLLLANSAFLDDDSTVGLVTAFDRATAHFERALHEALAPSCTRLNDLSCPISRGYRTRDGPYY